MDLSFLGSMGVVFHGSVEQRQAAVRGVHLVERVRDRGEVALVDRGALAVGRRDGELRRRRVLVVGFPDLRVEPVDVGLRRLPQPHARQKVAKGEPAAWRTGSVSAMSARAAASTSPRAPRATPLGDTGASCAGSPVMSRSAAKGSRGALARLTQRVMHEHEHVAVTIENSSSATKANLRSFSRVCLSSTAVGTPPARVRVERRGVAASPCSSSSDISIATLSTVSASSSVGDVPRARSGRRAAGGGCAR